MWKRKSHKNIGLSDTLYQYLLSISLREPPLLTPLRQETKKRFDGVMQIAPDQGQLMALLVQLMGAKEGIEIGPLLAIAPSGWL